MLMAATHKCGKLNREQGHGSRGMGQRNTDYW